MKETKELTQVNDSMAKKTLLKACKVIGCVALVAALAGGCSQPTRTMVQESWKSMPWDNNGLFKSGVYCGPSNPDFFLCYNTVASQSGLGGLQYCTGTQECRESTENVFLNALYYQWNIVEQGQSVVHDLDNTGHKGDPVLQRYISYGYNGFPCTTPGIVSFAKSEADAWTCGSSEWNYGYLGDW